MTTEASATAVAPLLAAEGVTHRYGGRDVLSDISFGVAAGEILGIVGPNGAGKSTLFRVLLGLERPVAGRVLFRGVDSTGRPPAGARLAGVFQRPVLFRGTVRDNVGFGLRQLPSAERRERLDDALRWFGLARLAAVDVRTLSGGEAQRVALARALALRPDVLLLDEPTGSLDVTMRGRFLHEVMKLGRDHALSVVLITHDARDVFGLADRLVVMHEGRVAQVGTPDEILLRPQTAFAAELTGAELLLDAVVLAVDDRLVTLVLPDDAVVYGTLAAGEYVVPGDAAQLAYRPEDVVLATDDAGRTSQANALAVMVDALTADGAHVRARLRSAPGSAYVLSALLTRRSVEELGIRPGAPVRARIKASALHVWQRDGSTHFG